MLRYMRNMKKISLTLIPLLFSAALGLALITVINAQTPVPTAAPMPTYGITPPPSPTTDPRLPVTVTILASTPDPVALAVTTTFKLDTGNQTVQPGGTYWTSVYRQPDCQGLYAESDHLPFTNTLTLSPIAMNELGNFWVVIHYSGDALYRSAQTYCAWFPVAVDDSTDTATPTRPVSFTPPPTMTPGPPATATPLPAAWEGRMDITPLCRQDPGRITLSGSVVYTPSLTSAPTANFSAVWWNSGNPTPVCPAGNSQCDNKNAAYSDTNAVPQFITRTIGAGETPFTLTVWWTGVITGDIWSQVDVQMQVVEDGANVPLSSNLHEPYAYGGRFWTQAMCMEMSTSTPVPTVTATGISTSTATATQTRAPSATVPVPTTTPTTASTPTQAVWSDVYSDVNSGLLCKYDAGWITTTNTMLLSPPGAQAIASQNWYVVSGATCPPGENSCTSHNDPAHHTSTLVKAGVPTTLTQVIWWPGITASDAFVQVDRSMTVSGLDGSPLQNTAGVYSQGIQTLWSSLWSACPVPTGMPTATYTPTNTPTPTSTPMITATSTRANTATLIPTPTATATLTPTATRIPTDTSTATSTATDTATVTRQATRTPGPIVPTPTSQITPMPLPTQIATGVPGIALHKGWNRVDTLWVASLSISQLRAYPHVVIIYADRDSLLIDVDADTVLQP